MSRPCCQHFDELRAHLATLTPASPTPEQAKAVEALKEAIDRDDDRHMEASW